MPNRIIKETICTSDTIDALTWFEEVLFYRLIVNCDDFGRYDGRPAVIKNRLFPLKNKLSITTVSTALKNLARAGLIVVYEHDGRPYLYLPTWANHQTVRAKKSKYPTPDYSLQASESICNQMQANVPVIENVFDNVFVFDNENENEEAGKPPRAPAFKPPTVEEVAAYCLERQNGIDPEAFVNFYEGTNWFRGKTKIKDWKACVRTWEKRDRETPPREKPQPKPKQYTTAAQYEATKPKTIDADKLDAVRAAFGL